MKIKMLPKFSKIFFRILVIFLLLQFFCFAQTAHAATALTNVTDTATSTKVSTSTSHKIDFTTYTTVPTDGKIVITFPSGFNVAAAAFSAWSGFDGNKTVSVSGQVVTVTRTTGGTASTAGGKYITLSGITNTATIETNYTVTVETQNSSGATLDGPTTSYYFSICANACHTATYQIPWTSTVSTSGKHTTKFTTASAIPANAKIKLTFPAGFDISGATFDSWSDFDGGESLAINGQVITITRDNTGTSKAAGAKYVVLNNIINNSTAGSAYYATLETTNAADANIEGPTSIRFSVVSTGLGVSSSAAWPVLLQNNKRTNKTTNNIPEYPTIEWKNTTVTRLLDGDGLIGNNNEIFAVKTAGNKQDLYALNADGTTKWIYNGIIEPAATMFLRAGAIDNEGTIYLSAAVDPIPRLDAIYAIDNSGQLKWFRRDNLDDAYSHSLDLNNDGSIFLKGLGTIYSGDGLTKSGVSAGFGWAWASPTTIDSNNVIYATQNGTNLYAINPDGTTKWTYTSGTGVFRSAPSIDSDGTLYISTIGASAHLRAVNSTDGTVVWDVVIPGGVQSTNQGPGSVMSIGQNRLVSRSDQNDKIYVFDKAGTLITTITESDAGASWRGGITLDNNDNLLYFTDDKKLTARDISGNLKWRIYGTQSSVTHAPIIGVNQRIYATDATNGGVLGFKSWTLSASLNRSDYYNPGDTITFTATTSMLTTDPVTAEANQAQVYLSDGTIVPLTYASTNSSGNTVWTGTHTISSGKPNGTYTATFEVSAVNVETDTTTHFASAPTNSNNTGITSSLSYTVKKQSRAAPSQDAPRPSDLPNSSDLALTDPGQQPTPPKASKYNPDGGFDLLLNGGAQATANPEVALYLFGGPDTKYMQISEDPTFKGVKQEKYTPHIHYNLKDNKLGKHTIYIRYFTLYDVSSETVSQSILLTKTTPPSSPPSQAATPSVPICTTAIIKTGDTLWDLAVRYFTEGSLYPNLINLNKNTYSSLVTNPGYLRLGWEIKVECK